MKTGKTRRYMIPGSQPPTSEEWIEVYPNGLDSHEVLFLHDLPRTDKMMNPESCWIGQSCFFVRREALKAYKPKPIVNDSIVPMSFQPPQQWPSRG